MSTVFGFTGCTPRPKRCECTRNPTCCSVRSANVLHPAIPSAPWTCSSVPCAILRSLLAILDSGYSRPLHRSSPVRQQDGEARQGQAKMKGAKWGGDPSQDPDPWAAHLPRDTIEKPLPSPISAPSKVSFECSSPHYPAQSDAAPPGITASEPVRSSVGCAAPVWT
jgi:hypothetical protein